MRRRTTVPFQQVLTGMLMVLFCCCLLAVPARDDSLRVLVEAALQAQKSPVTVTHRNGFHFTGRVVASHPAGIVLTQRLEDGGEVDVEFVWEDILRVQFQGDDLFQEIRDLSDSGDLKALIRVMEPLLHQRSAFFPVLNADSRAIFLLLVDAYMRVGDPQSALALIRLLRDGTQNGEDFAAQTEERELLALVALGLGPEAEEMAFQRISEAAIPSESALPWIILGARHLERGEHLEAWFCISHVLVFGTARNSECELLHSAYFVAMMACLAMDRADDALRYHREWASLDSDMLLIVGLEPERSKWDLIDWERVQEDAAYARSYAAWTFDPEASDELPSSRLPTPLLPLRQQDQESNKDH